jgi:integrase
MPAMPRPALPYLLRERNRHGATVWYVRLKRGPRIRIRGEYGSVAFLAAYEAAVAGETPSKAAGGPAQGTFAWGLKMYRGSQAWGALSLATRRQRENIFKPVLEAAGGQKLSAFKRGDIAKGRDKRSARPSTARHFVDAMRGFFKWAVKAGVVRHDPTQGVDVVKVKSEGFAVWTEADIAAFRKRWPLGTRERVAFEVLWGTGLRRGDAARVGRPHLRDGVIRITTEKTGERVAIAVGPELAQAIEAGPIGALTFIATSEGRPLTKESFGNWFREACNAAEVKKSAHGLRKAAATADAADGWSDAELDAKFGWTGRRMASLYTRTASRERLSLAASERTKSRTKKPAPGEESADYVAENVVKTGS